VIEIIIKEARHGTPAVEERKGSSACFSDIHADAPTAQLVLGVHDERDPSHLHCTSHLIVWFE
jgi:hypothetical protein